MICAHFIKFTQPVLGSGRLCLSSLLKAVYSSREKKYFIIRRGGGSSGGNLELWVFKKLSASEWDCWKEIYGKWYSQISVNRMTETIEPQKLFLKPPPTYVIFFFKIYPLSIKIGYYELEIAKLNQEMVSFTCPLINRV